MKCKICKYCFAYKNGEYPTAWCNLLEQLVSDYLPKDKNDCTMYVRKETKPKMKRIKEWGHINALQGIWADTWNTRGEFPCTILIDTKYLKEKK